MNSATSQTLMIRELGRQDYVPLWHAMQQFTDSRTDATGDEIWLTEHPRVFTMGINAGNEHLLAPGDIPVVQIDRGGQVTFHGPGQLMIYPLIDLKRAAIGVRTLVTALEQSVVDLLAESGIAASSQSDAPGVYADGDKVASIGLRIRRGCSFHGMALNVDADLEPFSRINPCGYAGLKMTDLKTLGSVADLESAGSRLLPHLLRHLGLADQPIRRAGSELPAALTLTGD